MKGFKLDSNGDVSIVNNQIEMVEGGELLCQTVQSVLSTNKGEWVLNPDEGINFHNLLGKQQGSGKSEIDIHRHYEGEIEYLKQKDRETYERLRKRLDGDL